MAKITICYQRERNVLVPSKMIIFFGAGNIKWEKDTLYIPFGTRFRRQLMEDFKFHEDTLSLSVFLTELVTNPAFPGKFGISLSSVLDRLERMMEQESKKIPYQFNDSSAPDNFGLNYLDIEQFIISFADIVKVMQIGTQFNYSYGGNCLEEKQSNKGDDQGTW